MTQVMAALLDVMLNSMQVQNDAVNWLLTQHTGSELYSENLLKMNEKIEEARVLIKRQL